MLMRNRFPIFTSFRFLLIILVDCDFDSF
jgi:hypothetical protein